MSMKLNLADRLLAMGRKFQNLGRHHDARQILGKLAAFGELPPEVAEETHLRLGEIHLKRPKLRRAQRHITAALLHRPDSARYHYLLATTLDTREPAEAKRASDHYRRSLELDPDQPRCLSEYGLLATKRGKTEEGLAALRRAVDMAPADPEVAGKLVEALRQEDQVDEARAVLRAAMFRNSRDPRFHKLRSDFEFRQLRRRQRAVLRKDRSDRKDEDQPVLLPFVRLEGEASEPKVRKTVRRDRPGTPATPHFPRHHRQDRQKRAQ
jgi:Tfp pilus assembly protein PilF